MTIRHNIICCLSSYDANKSSKSSKICAIKCIPDFLLYATKKALIYKTFFEQLRFYTVILAPAERLELTTLRLTAACSTD